MANPSALHILQDSGAPEGTGYTTVFLVHGFAWHSGIFAKVLPLARTHNARVILVNRRDYPGATPYTPAELAVLQSAVANSDSGAALKDLLHFMKERARELYDFLVRFVAENDIPPAQLERNAGGIVLVGWSFCTAWMTGLLANLEELGVDDVELSRYVRRIIFYDPPHHSFGFPPPTDPYNPLADTTIAPEETTRAFTNWVSGYYVHGDSLDELERRTHLKSPPPTLSTLTDEERAMALYPDPGNPGGSDSLLLFGGGQAGLFSWLRDHALALPENTDQEADDGANPWRAVEVRYVWCDHSVWEVPWGVWSMQVQLQKAKAAGKPLRDVRFLRLRGSNHFVHWDQPEVALRAFLANVSETSNAKPMEK